MTDLQQSYRSLRDEFLVPAADRLEGHLKGLLAEFDRIDRISVRAKGVDRFLQKAFKQEDGRPKYTAPLEQIQDQVGARIVT